MDHNVFISYSPPDKPIADAICTHLEAAGIRCWIAPRDLTPGKEEMSAIGAAIAQSGAMVLIFSADSNPSEAITHQLYLAANAGAAIITLKVDEVIPLPAKRFYLGRTQWLEATRPPTSEQMEMLLERTREAMDQAQRARRNRKRLTATRWLIGIAVVGLMAFAGFGLIATTGLFKPAVTPANVAVARTLLPTRTPTVPSPTLSPTATPVPATTTPSLTPAPTSTPTRIPGVPIANVIPGQAVFEENFSNPKFEGTLPPSFLPDCPGMSALQKNGFLELAPSRNHGLCRIDFRISLQPQQFRYFETRFQFSNSSLDTELSVGMGVDQVSPLAGERLGVTCLHSFSGFDCDVGYRIHEPIYRTPDVTFIKSNTWTVVRIELTNPQTLQWTFLIDNKIVGSYQVPTEEVAWRRMGTLEFYIFEESLPTATQVVDLDDIAILAR